MDECGDLTEEFGKDVCLFPGPLSLSANVPGPGRPGATFVNSGRLLENFPPILKLIILRCEPRLPRATLRIEGCY